AIVKAGTERDQLENLGISEPTETNPGRAWALANGKIKNFCGDPLGFREENLFVRHDRRVWAQRPSRRHVNGLRHGRPRNHSRTLPDDLDLQRDIPRIPALHARPGAMYAGRRLVANRDAGRIADHVSIARRYEVRYVQTEQGQAFRALQWPN